MKKLWLTALIVFIIDQVCKLFFTGKNIFIFRYTENFGVAFSLFEGGRWFFISIALVLIFFIWYYRNKINKNLQVPLGLLVGGALGNTFDRLFFGFVRDFIDLGFWPVFNVADIANCVAVVFIVYYTWKEQNTF